ELVTRLRASSRRFYFHAPATTELYTLSLHDALPILPAELAGRWLGPESQNDRDLILRANSHVEYRVSDGSQMLLGSVEYDPEVRSEEHTSELQSRENLVCRLLLEKKKHNNKANVRSI